MTARDELLDLADAYLAGALDEEGLAELERRICAEPSARRLFWVAVNHEVLLRRHSSFGEPAREPALAPTRTSSAWWQRTGLRWSAAAVLLLAVGALVIGGRQLHASAPLAEVASLTAIDDAGVVRHADQRSEPLKNGMPIVPSDRLELGAGTTLDLRWRTEPTVITLAGGATAFISDGATGSRLRLEQGSLAADVAHQPAGKRFIVATAQSEVTVIGTRFAVTADAARTSVDVEQGQVRVADVEGRSVDLGPGKAAVTEDGKAVTLAAERAWQWSDRRPIGLMMLCAAEQGWPTNPRGWFNDPSVDVISSAGRAAFQRRVETMIEQTIVIAHDMHAQAVVFWDLEGREFPLGYVGDPRQLARLAPEMEAVADRMFSRLRAAGFAVGMALRSQAAVLPGIGKGPVLRPVGDPSALLAAKIAYARQRWNATIFPVLGQEGGAMGMATICRRVVAAHPDILLMPAGDDAGVYRWSAPWLDPAIPVSLEPDIARHDLASAFGVHKVLEPAELERRYDELVRRVAAGDILTFRAWYHDPGQALVKRIYESAKPSP